MSPFSTIAVFVALPLRLVLDAVSIVKPGSNFDVAYASLFVLVGIATLFDGAPIYLPLAAFAFAAWYLLRIAHLKHGGRDAVDPKAPNP